MALTKPTSQNPATEAATAVKAVGSFESMDETTAGADAANEATSEPVKTASVPVVQQTGAVATVSKKEASEFQKEVEAMKGAADFSYGNYAVFKGIQGNIKGVGDNKVILGRWVKVSMIAWDDRIQVSSGSDGDEGKACVAYSADGITIDSVISVEKYGAWIGKPVAAYLSYLQTGDWAKASASRFIDVACVVHEGESKDSKAMAGEIICVSLSKSSIPSFSQYQEKLTMKAKAIARGIPGVTVPADPFTFYFVAENASNAQKQEWTKIKVADKLPEF